MRVFGLIGGSGLDSWAGTGSAASVDTPYGPASSSPVRFEFENAIVWFIPRHGSDHSIAPHNINYRANIWALRELAVEAIIAVNAVGSLDLTIPPGALVLPDQLIDYSWGRDHSFLDGEKRPLEHIEFGSPYDNLTADSLLASANQAGVAVSQGGCLGVTQGPRLETNAEIARMQRDGCDLVGMTSMPEAALARELGLPYSTVAVVANYAAGVTDEPVSMTEIEANLSLAISDVRKLLGNLFEEI